MKNLINWIYNNIALAVIFGLEGLVLVFGIVWVIAFTFDDNDKKPINHPVVEQNLTIIEIEDFIYDKVNDCIELQDFNLGITKKIVKNNTEESVANFINEDSDILFMSRELTEIELKQISNDRLPISQINISCDSILEAQNYIYMIKDNYHNNSLFDISKAIKLPKLDIKSGMVIKNS